MHLLKAIGTSSHHFEGLVVPDLRVIEDMGTKITPEVEVAKRFIFKSTVRQLISIPK